MAINEPTLPRRVARPVKVGTLTLGGDAPVAVQSMTNTRTADVDATVAQVCALAQAGADLVRVAAATPQDTAALPAIVSRSPVGIIADVHFHFQRALEAIDAGVVKIRLNPGNLTDRDQVREVIAAARDHGCAIRVGVNEGSIVERVDADRKAAELARPMDELMAEKMADYLTVFDAMGFDQLVLSAKSPSPVTTIAATRRLAAQWPWPIHLGVTHAGTPETGAIRSAAALGALLAEGIGDTIRISYAGDPVAEVTAACELLASLNLRARQGVELIACPTCGRTEVDLIPIADAVAAALADIRQSVKVAVMGCIVNGPGEAEGADVAICAGKGKAVLYVHGQKVRTISEEEIVAAVVEATHAVLASRD
jgi:(E)-4-hydroxy-3-methylbut-2-enyl-diphosphate synthase